MNVLVTGGAGYIGTHTVLELLTAGHTVCVVDSLVNSSAESLRRVQEIADKSLNFQQLDLLDKPTLNKLFEENQFDAVIHFAGLKAVGESVEKPLLYYRNNLDSTLTLCEVMQAHNVKQLVFSSSATVYNTDEPIPWSETTPAGRSIGSPYGRTKYMVEQILTDLATADNMWRIALLRYFNPIGTHPSGRIGEDPHGIPNNLMPFVAQVAVGKRPELSIFGDDYPTPDGTCIRDYIHVIDLAKGHAAALNYLQQSTESVDVFNLGSGKGTSVLELVTAFMDATGKDVPYKIAPRRPGDAPAYYADVSKAKQLLGWRTELSIEDACRDTWNWQSHNPNGYIEQPTEGVSK